MDFNNKKIYDTNFKYGELLEKINDNIQLIYTQYDGAIGVADRDSVLVEGLLKR